MLLDEAKNFTDLILRKTSMLSKFNAWLKPELGLAILPLNMHMLHGS